MSTVLILLAVLASLIILLLWVYLRSSVILKGKHVVVVGGSSGIGLEIAKLLYLEGAKITIIARNISRLHSAKYNIESYPTSTSSSKKKSESGMSQPNVTDATSDGSEAISGKVRIISVDVTKPDETRRAIERAIFENGPIDWLVCSQGISKPATFDDLTLETMHEVMDTNYWGTINVIKAALPHMKKSYENEVFEYSLSNEKSKNLKPKARNIAVISSQAGQLGVYGLVHYSASKFALRGFCESLQQEVYNHAINISLIFPPDTETPQLIEENKTKPELTKLISGTSVALTAKSVATSAIAGIKRRKFLVSMNFEGFFLTIATAGMSPQPNFFHAAVEIFLAGISRLAAICVVSSFYHIIRKHSPIPKGSLKKVQ